MSKGESVIVSTAASVEAMQYATIDLTRAQSADPISFDERLDMATLGRALLLRASADMPVIDSMGMSQQAALHTQIEAVDSGAPGRFAMVARAMAPAVESASVLTNRLAELVAAGHGGVIV